MGSMKCSSIKQGYAESRPLSNHWERSPNYPLPRGAVPAALDQGLLAAATLDVFNQEPIGEAMTMPPGSRLIVPVEKGFVRMRGRVALDDRSTSDDIEGAVRFFIFGAEPDRARLVRVSGEPPETPPPPFKSIDEATQRLYLQLFARKPNSQETRIVKKYFEGGKLAPAALEDLLWSLLLHPEFQYLY